MHHQQQQPALWRLPTVLAATGLSRSTLYAWIAQGSFPKQVRLGARTSGWSSEEVGAWIRSRIAASRGATQ